jgi:putative transposase
MLPAEPWEPVTYSEADPMPQTYICSYHHFIFSTKHRVPQITSDLRQRLYEYMGGIFHHENARLIAAGGTEDHVHLLASLNQRTALSEIMRLVKANSSKWIHETLPGKDDFGWQDGFAAFSVSFSNLERVQKYIDEQATHHRRQSFEEELIKFLKRHHIPYDERYICE